ncbi:MAG: Archaeal flagella protein [Candidatus Argoarchaeum ethanivorans]|uniref:Archaeal flagella protein n=1 Tax=Candidatus Argoarchaeum ethanivorans TaxID=2608793 RepID=A0A811TBQ5_9EURY|nr:MAG: Archaeal flagella protein [Candidatus Argoarchaeum ethanivorans]
MHDETGESEEETQYVDVKKDYTDMIDSKLAEMKKRLPSYILNELGDSMKAMQLSEKECDAILNKTVAEFEQRRENIKDLNERTASIESNIAKLAELFQRTLSQPKPDTQPTAEAAVPKLHATQAENTGLSGIQPKPEAAISKELEQKQKTEPRLVKINEDVKSVIVMLKWIEFLMEKVGRENLIHTLEFYVDIGWIGDEIFSQIITYAKGMNIPQQNSDCIFTSELTAKDHIQSLLFIERLRGNEIDRQMISMLDREVASIKKGSEEIYGI